MWHLRLSSYIFSKVFISAESTIFGCLWIVFHGLLSQIMSNFYKNDALLYPATYIPIYSHLKGVININNVGKFHLYSICGCHVIKFQMLLWWWSIHEMAHFEGSLRPNSPKYCPIVPKFLPEVVLKERKTMFAESWNFHRSGRYPNFAHLVQLWAQITPWRWPKSRKTKKQ